MNVRAVFYPESESARYTVLAPRLQYVWWHFDLDFDMCSLHVLPLLIETRVSLNEPALRRRGVEDQAVFMRARCSERVLRTTVVVPVCGDRSGRCFISCDSRGVQGTRCNIIVYFRQKREDQCLCVSQSKNCLSTSHIEIDGQRPRLRHR